MTFPQQSDVKKHLARPVKKTHYLSSSEPKATAEGAEQSSEGGTGGGATLLDDDREPILVTEGAEITVR